MLYLYLVQKTTEFSINIKIILASVTERKRENIFKFLKIKYL